MIHPPNDQWRTGTVFKHLQIVTSFHNDDVFLSSQHCKAKYVQITVLFSHAREIHLSVTGLTNEYI